MSVDGVNKDGGGLTLPEEMQTIHAGENPLDLRPIVRQIMEAENWLLERMPKGQRLVVLLGERHSSLMQSFLWQAVLKAHVENAKRDKSKKFAFGYEANRADLTHIPLELDPHGMTVLLGRAFNARSVKSFREFSRFLLRHGISTSFNDISYKIDGELILIMTENGIAFGITQVPYINQQNPLAAKLIQTHRPDLKGDKIARAVFLKELGDQLHVGHGIALSNHAMVENAMDHMNRTRPPIYIQHCGARHLTGGKDSGYPAHEGLVPLFQEKGFCVLPIKVHSDEIADIHIQGITIHRIPPLYDHEWHHDSVRKLVKGASGGMDLY